MELIIFYEFVEYFDRNLKILNDFLIVICIFWKRKISNSLDFILST